LPILKSFDLPLARLTAGHVTVAGALQTTSWLYDVARLFAQCGEAQAGTPAQRYSLCYVPLGCHFTRIFL